MEQQQWVEGIRPVSVLRGGSLGIREFHRRTRLESLLLLALPLLHVAVPNYGPDTELLVGGVPRKGERSGVRDDDLRHLAYVLDPHLPVRHRNFQAPFVCNQDDSALHHCGLPCNLLGCCSEVLGQSRLAVEFLVLGGLSRVRGRELC